jgi:TolB-like protein/tetratricopeptide (TPR) repeat protein
VFLSYASQDVQAAQRISDALRAAGIEVWFDQSELRGGEAWDRQIRKQIHDCALFIPVISANAHARVEGYFRLEWKLAIDRSHLMAPDQTFLLPVVIDNTPQTDERIPDRFRELQWSRAPRGQPSAAFVRRVQGLLFPDSARAPTASRPPATPASAIPKSSTAAVASWRRVLVVVVALLAVAFTYLVVDKFWISTRVRPSVAAPSAPAPAAFAPPPHSIAVLPFVNMSGDKRQEYFSDGLTEEILNSLARINELQVSARTSSFSFRGKDVDVSTIAHKLNVASILEGSVRRAGNTVRVTAQLNNAVTGFHLWSQTYDRDLSNVLQLQTEIANAVASALQVTLLGDVAAKIELGGTRNPAAFDAFLRGVKPNTEKRDDLLSAIAAFTEAIRLDPAYALAFAARSGSLNSYAANWATGAAVQEGLAKAGADARRALELAPNSAEAHAALAYFYVGVLDLQHADEEYARARALEPGNSDILQNYGLFATQMGRTEEGLRTLHRAIQLDPLSAGARGTNAYALYLARHYEEAAAAMKRELTPTDHPEDYPALGLVYYALGNFEAARASCSINSEDVDTLVCLSVTNHKLGRLPDAESSLEKFRRLRGDADAYAYSEIYAQWGDTPRSLGWLEKALRLRDTGLILLKTDPLMDPLRKEPRFQAAIRELNFPD